MTQQLFIRHTTTYSYSEPVPFGLQQLRLTPRSCNMQDVVEWNINVEGGKIETSYDDQHMNRVTLISFDQDVTQINVLCEGTIQTKEVHGVVGQHVGCMPMWMYEKPTALTKAGPACRAILNSVDGDTGSLAWLHALSAAILEAVPYETGKTDPDWTAEDAADAAHGVCQDHTHIFLACCRYADIPARYVSGYLMMDDRTDQEAAHAWAEAYLEGLGWVGFDVSNGISPDTRYVRVATGLDYAEAAPISGHRLGTADEELSVQVQVQQ